MKRLLEFLPLTVCALLAYAVIFLMSSGSGPIGADTAPFLAPPPEHIETMHFGFKESVADSIWLRWIQDGDVCVNYRSESGTIPEVNSNNPDEVDKRFINPRHKNCDTSWGYKMLDAVTKLDERFKMPYMAGTMTLSVLVEDYTGASALFERGLSVYPNDWDLNYRAAYHFLFDKKDYARAAKLLDHAAASGGPFWLRSLAARLFTKTGQLELGLSSLVEFRKSYKEGDRGLIELDKRIAEIRRLLDKEATKK